jgi:Domain of unknown function (DUF4783)
MAHFSFTTAVKIQLHMKKNFTLLLLPLLLLLSSFRLQPGSIDDVIGALKSGNTGDLARFIDDNAGMELSLPDKSNAYSKSQAIQVLKDFFSNNGVKTFEVKHKGDNAGAQFCIGTLQTRSGNFRTTVYMKNKGGKQVVREIRFETIG